MNPIITGVQYMSEKKTILCVDDEESILNSLKRMLALEGYNVLTARGGEQGLEMLSKEKIDLIIADQRMPKMMGAEFLRRVREKRPEIVSIMLSGYSDFQSLVTAVNEGEIFRFISKPWDKEELLKTVVLALEQKNIVKVVQHLINAIGKIPEFADFSIETLNDKDCINLRIDEKGELFSSETVFKLLNFIFETLGVHDEERVKLISGAVSKQKGRIVLFLDIGREMNLKIELPSKGVEK